MAVDLIIAPEVEQDLAEAYAWYEARQVDRLSVGELPVSHFAIKVGAMDYGFAIDGMIETEVLLQVGAVIDLSRLEIHHAAP
jgi:hypothetical protein